MAVVVAYYIIVGAWMIVGFLANICIIFVLAKDREGRKVINLFMGSIAISDMLLAGLVLPEQLHDVSHADDYFEPDILCRLVSSTPVFCITSSIYAMVALSVERYRTIVIQSTTTMTPRHAGYVISAIWLFSFLASLPSLVGHNRVEEVTSTNRSLVVCKPTLSRSFNIANGLFLLVVGYIVPQCIIYFNYCSIMMLIVKHAKPNPEMGNSDVILNSSAVARHRVQIIKMLVLAAFLFSVSWAPYFVLGTLAIFQDIQDSTFNEGPVFLVRLCLACFSTSYNIVLYLKFNSHFRATFRRIFLPSRGIGRILPARNNNAISAPAVLNRYKPGHQQQDMALESI